MHCLKATFSLLLLLLVLFQQKAFSDELLDSQAVDAVFPEYLVNPGDILSIHVWGEIELSQREVLVRPDGKISQPIVGEIHAGGKSIKAIQDAVSQQLSKFLRDKPVVTVSIAALSGNTIYVLGKVARPGEYVVRKNLDVTQALALAGGVTTFAKQNDIKILRRDSRGIQTALKFKYAKIEDGNRLEENIILKSGDVILVP